MDWALAIERNRETLMRIVSSLFGIIVAARLSGAGLMIPRSVWRAVWLVLRPAEAAVRRLVLIAARGLKPILITPRASNFTGIARAALPCEPAFRLLDPLRDLSFDEEEMSSDIEYVNASESIKDWSQSDAPDLPVNAIRLHNRLRALRHALADLASQARRLARWQARRDAALKAAKPTRLSPIRPGLPPGWRMRRIHEIDQTLRECHGLARDFLNAPDTS
jgi:hypothetical protein